MRILIDHTTAHAFDTNDPHRDSYHAIRALLQFVDELCFASEIWISNTESGQTRATTEQVVGALGQRGILSSAGTPLVQTYSISDFEFERRILTRAARRLLESILRAELSGVTFDRFIADNRLSAREIRTSVTSAKEVPGILKDLVWGSERHASEVKRLVKDKERGPAAALLLLHEPLFAWAKPLVAARPSDDDPVYQHLHMLSRVQINLELAAACADVAGAEVQYAPAYARAAAMAHNYLPRPAASLYFLQERLWETFLAYKGDVPQGATLTVPLIGATVLLSLPEHSTLTNLLDAVGEVRGSDVGVALRDLVSERRSALDVNALIAALMKKFKVSSGLGKSLKARTTIMTTPPFGKMELISEKDLTNYANVSLRDVLAYLYSKPDVVVLTAFMEDIFAAEFPLSDIAIRARHILRLAA